MYHLFSGSFDEKDNFNISPSEYHVLDNEKLIEKTNIYSYDIKKCLNFVRFNFSFSISSTDVNIINKQIIKNLNLALKFFNYYSNINTEIKDIRMICYSFQYYTNGYINSGFSYILIFPIIVSFSDNNKIIFNLKKISEINNLKCRIDDPEHEKDIIYYIWKYKKNYKTDETGIYKKYNFVFYRFCTNSNKRNCDLIEVKQDDKAFKISEYLIFNVTDLDFNCEYFNLNDFSFLKTLKRKRDLEMIYSKDKIKTYDPKELNEEMKIICNELFNEIIDYLKVINKKIIEKYKETTDLYYITLNFDDDEEAYLLTMDICDIQNKKEEAKISVNIINKVFEKHDFIIQEIIKHKEINEEDEEDEEEINDYFVSNINYKLYHKFFICFEKLVKINEINLKQIFKDKKINLVELKFIIETMKNTNKYLSDFDDDSQLDIPDVENIFKFFKLVLPYLNI